MNVLISANIHTTTSTKRFAHCKERFFSSVHLHCPSRSVSSTWFQIQSSWQPSLTTMIRNSGQLRNKWTPDHRFPLKLDRGTQLWKRKEKFMPVLLFYLTLQKKITTMVIHENSVTTLALSDTEVGKAQFHILTTGNMERKGHDAIWYFNSNSSYLLCVWYIHVCTHVYLYALMHKGSSRNSRVFFYYSSHDYLVAQSLRELGAWLWGTGALSQWPVTLGYPYLRGNPTNTQHSGYLSTQLCTAFTWILAQVSMLPHLSSTLNVLHYYS